MRDTIAVIDKIPVPGGRSSDRHSAWLALPFVGLVVHDSHKSRAQLAANRQSNSMRISIWHKAYSLASTYAFLYLLLLLVVILCISLSPVSYASHENVQQKWFNKLSNNSSSNLTGYRIGVCGWSWFDSMVLQFPYVVVVAAVVVVVVAVAVPLLQLYFFARCVWHDATKRSSSPINAPNSPQCSNVQRATRHMQRATWQLCSANRLIKSSKRFDAYRTF